MLRIIFCFQEKKVFRQFYVDCCHLGVFHWIDSYTGPLPGEALFKFVGNIIIKIFSLLL